MHLNEYQMDTKMKFYGYWFLEGQTFKVGIPGILKFSQKTLELVLFGGFRGSSSNDKRKYIFGFSHNNSVIIVHDAFMGGMTLNPGFIMTTYFANDFIILESKRLPLFNNLEFLIDKITHYDYLEFPVRGASFSFEGLNDWISESTTSVKTEYIISDWKYQKSNICGDNLRTVKLEKRLNTIPKTYEWTITNSNDSLLTFNNALSIADDIKNLFTLFTNTYLNYYYIEFIYDLKNNLDSYQINGRYFFHEEEFVEDKHITFGIKYLQLQEYFQTMLDNWSQKYDKLKSIINSYIGDLRLRTYLEYRLLNSIRDLEMYHRNFMDNKNTENKEDVELSRKKEEAKIYISKKFNGKFEERLINCINFDPETSLRTRLKTIFRHLPEYMMELIKYDAKTIPQSINLLVRKLVDTRNFYTHGDSNKTYEYQIKNYDEMFEIQRRLTLITKYYIYVQLGLPDEIIYMSLKDEIKFILRNQ